jgi:hypothetical protein
MEGICFVKGVSDNKEKCEKSGNSIFPISEK